MFSGDLLEGFEELYEFLYYGLGIAELGIAGVVLIGGLIAAVVTAILSALVALAVFVLEAIPLYKISKKMGRKFAWLVWLSWVPVVGGYVSTYVLADIPGNKPLHLVDKVTIKDRMMSFWIYAGIGIFGAGLITVVLGIVNVIPVLGQIVAAFSTLLYLVPPVAVAWIEYAYLRDVLDIFKEDRKSNRTVAIVIAALDALVTFGLARAVYLYTVMNKDPLPQQEIEVQSAEQIEV